LLVLLLPQKLQTTTNLKLKKLPSFKFACACASPALARSCRNLPRFADWHHGLCLPGVVKVVNGSPTKSKAEKLFSSNNNTMSLVYPRGAVDNLPPPLPGFLNNLKTITDRNARFEVGMY